MNKIKLSKQQKEVLARWQKYPNEVCVTLSDGYFLTGGHGVNIPKNTYWALKKRDLVSLQGYLTDLGKSIDIS
jgi:hypothetical protein